MISSRLGCLVLATATVAVPAVAQTSDPFAPPIPDLKDERLLPADRFDGLEGLGGDGVRTMSAFPRNLTRGLGAVFTRDSLRPFLIGALAAGAGSFADRRLQDDFAGHSQSFGNVGARAGSARVVVPLTAGLFLAGRVARDDRFRAATYDVAEAAIVTSLYTTTLKSAVRRNRPDTSNRLSFPSGHTSSAFAMAAVFDAHYGSKVSVPAYVTAAAIGISRMERNKHHLSDVLAGATIGYLVGHSVAKQNGVPARGRETRFNLTPATDANGSGMGAGFSLSW